LAAEHLRFTVDLLDLFPPDDPRRHQWRGRIDQVSRRLTDPCHHLAVIGEFSSGKTTFINALLGDELFPTSALPTTAASVSIRYGRQLAVRARFVDGTHWPGPDGRSVPELRGLDHKTALVHLTTGHTLAPNVRSVEVEHPAPVLAGGLVIIDTPGTNAEQGHSAIARTAVGDADAAVVVLTALQLVPDSLREFLTGALDPHLLARCGYVVTRMDQIEPVERERIHQVALSRVSGRLGVTDPALVLAAPAVVLRDRRGAELTADEQAWLGHFADTRRWLDRLVHTNRPTAVADTALRLIDGLLVELDGELATDLDALDGHRRALEAARLTDMDGFLADQLRRVTAMVKEGRQAAGTALEREHTAALDRVRAEIGTVIERCTSKAALEKALRTEVPAVVRAQADALARTVDAEARSGLGGRLQRATKAVAVAFEREYDKLAKASGTPRAVPPPVAQVSADEHILTGSFASAVAVAVTDQSRDNKVIGWGAGAGAAIGTLIAPGPGTVIGALVGAFFGGVTTRNLSEVKREARTEATGTAESIFATIRLRLEAAIREASERHEQALADHLHWYRASYQHVIDGLREEHARQLAQLHARGERLALARRQTANRRTALARERADLSRVAAPLGAAYGQLP
jgi:hypothetical protein